MTDQAEYEAHVARTLEAAGASVAPSEIARPRNYDLTLKLPDGRLGAVAVRLRKSGPVPHPLVNKLKLFLDSPAGEQFDFGITVVSTRISSTTEAMLENSDPTGKDDGVFAFAAAIAPGADDITWFVHTPEALRSAGKTAAASEPEAPGARRVAIYTDKGGVGKTSLAAHLAGAICYQGGDAVLVDVDPQRNLRSLLGEGVNVTTSRGPTALSVEDWAHFQPKDYPGQYIVYDCSPSFEANPIEVFRAATDVVIPIVLSPLSILDNAVVIDRSISNIRRANPDARIVIVINQFVNARASQRYNGRILQYLRHHLRATGVLSDPKVRFLEPDAVCIRRSDHLLHWGIFLLEAAADIRPTLAFDNTRSGAQNLLGDFLALADHLAEA